jgi:hypothetical protein
MISRLLVTFLLANGVSSWVFAQVPSPKIIPRNLYERILMIVPMTGSGKWDDPRRPLFAPAHASAPTDRTGILGYSFQVSDDGKYALVEFVAHDKNAFQTLKSDARTMKFFEKGNAQTADIDAEFKKYKKDFNWQHFGTRVQ